MKCISLMVKYLRRPNVPLKRVWVLPNYGFGSQINNLLFFLYYVSKHYKKGKSIVISNYSNSYYKVGLSYYFRSNQYFNNISISKKLLVSNPVLNKLIYLLICLRYQFDTDHFLAVVRLFCFDELAKNRLLFESEVSKILTDIWKFNPEIQREIDMKIDALNLPDEYISIHIRWGDKIQESKLFKVAEYMQRLPRPCPSHIFIMTDDFDCIRELEEKYKEYNFIYLTRSSQKGNYTKLLFNKNAIADPENNKKETIQLLTEIEIAKKSALFIGTYSSNLFRLIYTFGTTRCISVEDDNALLL